MTEPPPRGRLKSLDATSLKEKVELEKLTASRDINAQGIHEAVSNITSHVQATEEIFGNNSTWMHEWNSVFAEESSEKARPENVQYDVSIFGPKLRGRTNDELGVEIMELLLKRESDFTDAMISVDQDNFLSEPYDCLVRDGTVLKSVVAALYASWRELFLSFPLEQAMSRLHHYRDHVRSLRGLLYLTTGNLERIEGMNERINRLEDLKDKYEATIFTLRRQLEDFHAEANSVGRSAEGGGYAVQGKSGPATSLLPSQRQQGANASTAKPATKADVPSNFIIAVQIEDLQTFRTRHRQLIENAMNVAKDCIVQLAQGYELQRTNYIEEKEQPQQGKTIHAPQCYLFVTDTAFNALAYAMELHHALVESEEWPKTLLDMSKFSTMPWRGLKVRVSVHYGALEAMDLPEPTKVIHYEGVAVEKTMRLAQLGVSGDTLCTALMWSRYQEEMQKGIVPPSKRYHCLRGVETAPLDVSKKRGFKKGEFATRCWLQALAVRQTQPADAEFSPMAFYKLEATSKDAADGDDDAPTVEELIEAKDMQVNVMQQELDNLQLAVMKRDSDMEMFQADMKFTLEKLRCSTTARTVYYTTLVETYENQIMALHDPPAVTATTGSVHFVPGGEQQEPSVDERRREMFQAMAEFGSMVSDAEDEVGSPGAPSKKGSRTKLHKNQRMWRDLQKMVSGATKKVVQQRSLRRDRSSGSISAAHAALMLRLHSVIRVYSTLIRRFTTESEETDSDNQSITEDQFISLFMRKVTNDAIVGSAREGMNLMAQAAIDAADIEEANANDENRLVKSIGGHLSRIFNYIRGFKKRSLVEIKLSEHQPASDATGEPATLDGSTKSGKARGGKGSKKGSLGGGPSAGASPAPGNALTAPPSKGGGGNPLLQSSRQFLDTAPAGGAGPTTAAAGSAGAALRRQTAGGGGPSTTPGITSLAAPLLHQPATTTAGHNNASGSSSPLLLPSASQHHQPATAVIGGGGGGGGGSGANASAAATVMTNKTIDKLQQNNAQLHQEVGQLKDELKRLRLEEKKWLAQQQRASTVAAAAAAGGTVAAAAAGGGTGLQRRGSLQAGSHGLPSAVSSPAGGHRAASGKRGSVTAGGASGALPGPGLPAEGAAAGSVGNGAAPAAMQPPLGGLLLRTTGSGRGHPSDSDSAPPPGEPLGVTCVFGSLPQLSSNTFVSTTEGQPVHSARTAAEDSAFRAPGEKGALPESLHSFQAFADSAADGAESDRSNVNENSGGTERPADGAAGEEAAATAGFFSRRPQPMLDFLTEAPRSPTNGPGGPAAASSPAGGGAVLLTPPSRRKTTGGGGGGGGGMDLPDIPSLSPRPMSPSRTGLADVTVPEEFNIEERSKTLKEKWAKEKEERDKRRTTGTPPTNNVVPLTMAESFLPPPPAVVVHASRPPSQQAAAQAGTRPATGLALLAPLIPQPNPAALAALGPLPPSLTEPLVFSTNSFEVQSQRAAAEAARRKQEEQQKRLLDQLDSLREMQAEHVRQMQAIRQGTASRGGAGGVANGGAPVGIGYAALHAGLGSGGGGGGGLLPSLNAPPQVAPSPFGVQSLSLKPKPKPAVLNAATKKQSGGGSKAL